MNIATIYTLYGRRAGAELCFEKTIESIHQLNDSVKWYVFCNKDAYELIKEKMQYVNAIYVSFLDNQYKKAFWLEFLSARVLMTYDLDCFWIPSGCNHFPGRNWKIPVLTTFHDLGEYHIANKYSFARMVFRKRICIPRSVSRSILYTTVSNFTKQDMLKFLHINSESLIKVVYNGKSPHDSTIPENSEDIITQYGLTKNGYFFTPGRTDYLGKGLDVLISSFREFCKSNNDLKLVLVGPQGEGYDMLVKDLLKDDYCNGRVMYLGRVSEDVLKSLYCNCKSTIISSRFEGFGFPVLEAMEYGVPIICSNAGSLPEVVEDAAIVFESGNKDQLLFEMHQMCTISSDTLDILKEKRKKRLDFFSWERCASRMMECFNNIVNKYDLDI